MITASAIAPEIAAQRGYRSLIDAGELAALGFAAWQANVPALLVPGYGPEGQNGRHQIRPDAPYPGRPKYESAAGASIWLDVHPAVQPQLADPEIPLWITEGARKADAAVSAGACCISLQGVWCFRVPADWAHIALKDRRVYVAFDSDVVDKPDVRAALRSLAAFLWSMGADVSIVHIPPGPHGAKVGLDDYLAAGGTLDELIATATPGPRFGAPERDHDEEVTRLRERLELLEGRDAAQRRELHDLREENALIRRALANPEIREEVAATLAAIDVVDAKQRSGQAADGFVRVYLGDVADKAGLGRKAAGRHLQRAAALGVLSRVAKPRTLDTVDETGRQERRTDIWLSIDCKRDALKRLAYAQPVDDAPTVPAGRKRGHGGPACPKHPDAAVIKRTTITHICAACGDVLGDPAITETALNRDDDDRSVGHVGPRAGDEKRPWYASSQSVEWYTPPQVIERVVQVLGAIDLDPCADSHEAPNVPAGTHYTKDDDGLTREWAGRVFLNPPYGRSLTAWLEKLCTAYESGAVPEAIALLPSATGTRWYRRLSGYARCFLHGRQKFRPPDGGESGSATFDSLAVYLGPNRQRFCEAFADLGEVWDRPAVTSLGHVGPSPAVTTSAAGSGRAFVDALRGDTPPGLLGQVGPPLYRYTVGHVGPTSPPGYAVSLGQDGPSEPLCAECGQRPRLFGGRRCGPCTSVRTPAASVNGGDA
jgi:hypothetical protein